MLFTNLLTVSVSVSFANAATRNAFGPLGSRIPQIYDQGLSIASTGGTPSVQYFDQLKDHNNTNLGTFKQRYWVNAEFYQGGAIVLSTPGESNAETFSIFITNQTMVGLIAQQQKGAAIMLEHRFFGMSNPYDNLTAQSLELLTVEQAIEDLVYFSQNVNLTFTGDYNVKPHNTSWILVGGSYAGTLTAWTMVSKPGVFRAGYASSAVLETRINYYDYFTPIREYMPKNCSADIEAVIAYLDQNYAKNNTDAIQTLKEAFGLGGLSHTDDFAAALMTNLAQWQYLQPLSGPGSTFFKFCDALEVKDGISAPETGWGLEHAIQSWGHYWNDTYYSYLCGSITDVEVCLGSHNASDQYWTDVNVDNQARSWTWLGCNQLGNFITGPPEGQPAIASRIIQSIYWERQCVNMFPQKFSAPRPPPVEELITVYKGWNIEADRLFFANGRRDVWRGASVSADGLNKTNTTMQPIYESDAFHTSDLITRNGVVDETVHVVQEAALRYMQEWLS